MNLETNPIPEGFHTLTPYIIVDDGEKALDFYEKALGAKMIDIMEHEGRVVHAEFKIGDSIMMLSEITPDMRLKQQTGEWRAVSFMVYVPDVDAAAEKALAAGMKLVREVRDQFYGDRSGTFEDPFGHMWTIGTHIEDVDKDELKKRVQEMYS